MEQRYLHAVRVGPRMVSISAALAVTLVLPGVSPAQSVICDESGVCYPAVTLPFLQLDDEIASALAILWHGQFSTLPADPDEAHAVLQARVGARSVIETNPDVAAEYLVESMALLPPDDSAGHGALQPLLSCVADHPAILEALTGLLATGTGPPPDPVEEAPIPGNRLVRSQALEIIGRAARVGSSDAKNRLLQLLSSPDPQVRSGAVAAYYRASLNRRAAQRTMRPLLDVDEHYLLHR